MEGSERVGRSCNLTSASCSPLLNTQINSSYGAADCSYCTDHTKQTQYILLKENLTLSTQKYLATADFKQATLFIFIYGFANSDMWLYASEAFNTNSSEMSSWLAGTEGKGRCYSPCNLPPTRLCDP
jgi:hypothetical protein